MTLPHHNGAPPRIPEDMDVPSTRRDTRDHGNIRWLLRNLGVRNSNHPEFKTIIESLKWEAWAHGRGDLRPKLAK